jgi:hypothetical protein
MMILLGQWLLVATELESLPAPGLKEIKLYTKYRPLVPEIYQDELCPKPSDEVLKRVARQKRVRRGRVIGARITRSVDYSITIFCMQS